MNANGNGPTPWSGVTASFAPTPATTTYSGPSSNFAYDYLGNRIETIDSSGATTVLPTTLFTKVIASSGTTMLATTTKQLFLPGGSTPTMVSTIETTVTAPTTRYILTVLTF